MQEKALEGKRPCPGCKQLRTASDKMPDGQIRVLGQSKKIWCPYADDKSIWKLLTSSKREDNNGIMEAGNIAKKIKKQQLETDEKSVTLIF